MKVSFETKSFKKTRGNRCGMISSAKTSRSLRYRRISKEICNLCSPRTGLPQTHWPRVLFQRRLLTRIPIYYVVYSAGHNSKAHLWIVGTDRHVHAPSETGVRGLWNRLTR